MRARTRVLLIGLCLGATGAGQSAHGQFSVPLQATAAPSPEALFRNQCGTCHVLSPTEGPRQGPPLGGVVGRRAGSVAGFKYSSGFASADWAWDEKRLDAWLTNPQAVIPTAQMAYQQNDPKTRHAIIEFLKEQR